MVEQLESPGRGGGGNGGRGGMEEWIVGIEDPVVRFTDMT